MYVLMTTDNEYTFKELMAEISKRESALNIVLAHAYFDDNLDKYLAEFDRRFIVSTDDTTVIHVVEAILDGERNEDVFYIHSGHTTDEIFNEVTLRRLQRGMSIDFERLRLSTVGEENGRVVQLMLDECAAYLGRPKEIYGLECQSTRRIVPVAYFGQCATACRQLLNSKINI